MSQSFENFDKPYRRGLVLGLSLAEVFLILLFLLLLASIGLTSSLQEELVETKEKNVELQDSLTAFRDVIGNKITLEEFTRLQKNAAARQRLVRENNELSDRLVEVENELAQVNEVAQILEENNIKPEDLESIIEGKETLADALAKKDALDKKLDEALKENENLEKELVNAEIKAELAESQLADEKDEVEKIAKILDSIKDKGRSPPCWFRLVSDTKSGPNTKRQKDVKIFDVKIEDDGFTVIKHNNAKIPRPIDFGNPSGLPAYPDTMFSRKLTSKEFQSGFIPFFRAGDNNKIQPYKCVFMVDVYDYTSNTNKIGYKKRLKLVESMFAKFEEKSRWPSN